MCWLPSALLALVYLDHMPGMNKKKESDLDLLVHFSKSISLFDLVGLEIELSEKLGIEI